MQADEIQAVIDTVEAKRRELQRQQLGANLPMAKPLAIMPAKQNSNPSTGRACLDGNPQATQKARVFLREWFGGKIRLQTAGRRWSDGPLESKHRPRSSAPQ